MRDMNRTSLWISSISCTKMLIPLHPWLQVISVCCSQVYIRMRDVLRRGRKECMVWMDRERREREREKDKVLSKETYKDLEKSCEKDCFLHAFLFIEGKRMMRKGERVKTRKTKSTEWKKDFNKTFDNKKVTMTISWCLTSGSQDQREEDQRSQRRDVYLPSLLWWFRVNNFKILSIRKDNWMPILFDKTSKTTMRMDADSDVNDRQMDKEKRENKKRWCGRHY